MENRPRPPRPVRHAVVARTEPVTEAMVRVWLTGDELREIPELAFTDHYVKLIFPAPGAGYTWPFDPEELKQELPREQWPVTRTYTIRSFDRERNEMAIDFVVHGDEGIAGPWAQAAKPGDAIGFRGPGGAWAPDPDADGYVFVGDESAAPAIAAGLERVPASKPARAYVEVADPGALIPLPEAPDTELRWVHRSDVGGEYGSGLVAAVRGDALPTGDVRYFVHGNADMIKELRRFLLREQGIPRERVSISGYWRPGQNEDAWQAGKHDFVAAMEAEQDAAAER